MVVCWEQQKAFFAKFLWLSHQFVCINPARYVVGGVFYFAKSADGDQYLNGMAVEQRGMGINLHFNQLTKDSISDAIQRILNPRFVKNTVKWSVKMKFSLSSCIKLPAFFRRDESVVVFE